ncbi:MAG TPA: hypothetical protein DCM62_03005 [Bacteroidales bacterium]|nr:hypothetical protein [Bacteroidales bacterium]
MNAGMLPRTVSIFAKASDFLYRYSRLKTIIVVGVVFVAFQQGIFPHFMKEIALTTTYPIPDLIFGFHVEQAYDFVASTGKEGRKAYLDTLLWIDSLYPLVYSLFLSLIVGVAFKRIPSGLQKLKHLNILPFGAAIADYFENTGLIIVVLSYPTKTAFAAQLASIFGMIKWSIVAVSMAIIIISLLYMAFLALKFKKNHPTQ